MTDQGDGKELISLFLSCRALSLSLLSFWSLDWHLDRVAPYRQWNHLNSALALLRSRAWLPLSAASLSDFAVSGDSTTSGYPNF